MRELIIVAVVIGALALLGLANTVYARSLFEVSIWLVVGGFSVAVPTGVVYHVLLHRALGPRGELEKGWYWRPIQYLRALEGARGGRRKFRGMGFHRFPSPAWIGTPGPPARKAVGGLAGFPPTPCRRDDLCVKRARGGGPPGDRRWRRRLGDGPCPRNALISPAVADG